jgi:3-deoxy-D-manno-octulosonate 8-phosphate phosphatase (KDO 8-P phosphatase)
MTNYKVKLAEIKAMAFDVDGVFTDGSILTLDNGDLLRIQNAKDGFGLRIAVLKNYPIAIVTGAYSESVKKRFLGIGVPEENIYMKSRNKVPDFLSFCRKYELKPSEVAFVGDDIPDIPVLKVCGLAVCPSDAVTEVKEVCDYVSLYGGGRGCVRDLVEQILKMHNDWNFDAEQYSTSAVSYNVTTQDAEKGVKE